MPTETSGKKSSPGSMQVTGDGSTFGKLASREDGSDGAGSFRSDGRQSRSDEHDRGIGVVGLGDRCHGEVADHSWSKDEAVGGASELEVPELVALGDMASGFDARVDETGADL